MRKHKDLMPEEEVCEVKATKIHNAITAMIRKELERSGITQTELSWRMRSSRQMISAMLTNKSRHRMSLYMLCRLAVAMDMDVYFDLQPKPKKKGAK